MSFYSHRSNGLNSHWARHYPRSPFANRDADGDTPALESLPERETPSSPPHRITRVPPPAYAPSTPIPLTQTISSGSSLQRTRSRWNGSAASVVIEVPYLYHPALSTPLPLLWRLSRFLRRQPEALDDRWPAEFAKAAILNCGSTGTTRDGENGASALINASEAESRLATSYRERIATVNETVNAYLVRTRFLLACLEIVDIIYLFVLIIALGVTGGKQEGFLEGVEVALVVVIVLNAGFFNHIRLRRWRLSRRLRQYSVDWSPLPMTSSTARGLVANYVGPNSEASDDIEATGAPTDAGPALRWAMFGSRGGFWTAYRPLVRVELLMPSSRWFVRSSADGSAASGEDYVPLYSKELGENEQVAPAVAVLPSPASH